MSNHIFITYSELTGYRPAETELTELLGTLNKESTFRHLSMLNNFLALFPIEFDENKYVFIQRFFSTNHFDAELYENLRKFVEDISLVSRPIFHRTQILLLMKRVLFDGSVTNGLDPTDSREARNIIGKLCLMTSDFIVTSDQEEKTKSDNPHSEDETDRVLSELLAQMLPIGELMNPPEISASIVRTTEFLKFSNACFPDAFDGKSLSQFFESLNGITLERFLHMATGIYGSLITKELDELIDNPAEFNIRKSGYFENLLYTEKEVDAFYQLTSITFEDLFSELENSPLRTTLRTQYDYTVFRKYPYFHLSEDIITPIDFAFLTEKVSTGLYYTILNSLQKHGVNPKKFFQHWGLIFETYINNLFRELYPEWSQRFHPNKFYESKQKIEAFDGIIEYPDSLIVMQYKGGLLNTNAKYSGNVVKMLGEMNSKYGTNSNNSGICQLSINIERLFHAKSTRRLRIKDLDFSRINSVYPVLIVNEISLGFGLAHWKLRDWFEKELKTRDITEDLSVKPLLILTVEDVEMLFPYLEANDFTFLEFSIYYSKLEYIRFSRFLIQEHWYEPMTTIREVFRKFREEKNISRRKNSRREAKFDVFMTAIMDSFRPEARN